MPLDPTPNTKRLAQKLLAAIQTGDLATVANCLAEGKMSDWTDAMGNSPLWHALRCRRWAVAELLLAHGADIDGRNGDGWTLVFWAAFHGQTDIVSFLIAHRADPNLKTPEGEWALFWAVYEGYSEIVRLLLEAGARVDWKDMDGRDVLQLARTLHRTDIVQLLSAGARGG